MWGPRMGVHMFTRRAVPGLTTCTYIGIIRYANIEHTIADMQQRVTVDLEVWGGGLPQLGLLRC